MGKSVKGLLENDNLKPTTLIVCESGEADVLEDDLKDKFEIYKSGKYGVAYVNIFTPKGGVL